MLNAKPTDNSQQAPLTRLLAIMQALRNPEGGCPWDIQQTMSSLTRYTIEETYEVVDAIASGNSEDICDELGDLLFQIVFYAQIAKEEGDFTFDDVATAISDKMVRRHPHVFADEQVSGDELSAQWEKIKASEKAAKSCPDSFFASVPAELPALMYAQKLQKQCAKVGFDWPDVMPVLDKVKEEVDEIQQELDMPERNASRIEEEIGDALFAMVNLARHCNVDADTALRNASVKFKHRFEHVDNSATLQGKALSDYSLEELEALWVNAKQAEKARALKP